MKPNHWNKLLYISLVALVVFSCEEDLTKSAANKNKNFATQIIYNADILRKDSGVINLRFKAPLIEKYELVDSPFVEAKKGIYLEYFDKKNPKIPGKIWAKYARYNEKKDVYIAKGNVKIRTSEGQLFASQSIFWDKKIKKMYTSDTVYVTDKDGSTLVGANGMMANDDFSEYQFYNNTGTFPAKQISNSSK